MGRNYFGEKNNLKKFNMILVTGATGLVGSHLLYQLVKKGENVKALYRNQDKIKSVKKVFSYYENEGDDLFKKINWFKGDILDLYSLNEAFEGVTKVYHCAAIVSFDGSSKSKLIEANVQGTENIVNLCLEHKIEKLCHVSSIASLGSDYNGELVDENSKWVSSKNHSAYSVSKFQSEMVVWRGIQEGLNAVIVNPSVILGPGFWNSGSGSLFTKAAKGIKYFTSGGTGFVDVQDVAISMIKLMDSDTVNERFILNSENLKYKELFNLIADEVGVAKPKKEATKRLLKFASLLDGIASKIGVKKREITKDVIRAGLSVSQYSNEKIKEAVGVKFLPVKTSIQEIAIKFKKELTIS